MPQVIDLRPDFGNDFARIFMEKEQLKLQQERQKLLEQQTKYENEQKEAEIARSRQAMEGQTAGIMQGLLGTPQGRELLSQSAQPYADAFNTFFGGGGAPATPEQLGLSPEGMATGMMQSPEPYAAAGFASALKDQEQQQYTRGFAQEGREEQIRQFDKSYGLDERRLEHAQWLGEQNLELERIGLELQKNNADRVARLQGMNIVQGMQDRVLAAFRADVGWRINYLKEDPRTAYQQSSLEHFGRVTPPSGEELNSRAGTAMDYLSQGLPISMVSRMALGDGSDPLRQLANMGLDERVVNAIARGYNAGEDPYNMYKDVHEAITQRRASLTKDEASALKARTGLDPDDYFASQLNTFTTWFAENYPEDDPARLVKIYKNSLASPPREGLTEDLDITSTTGYSFFLANAITAWDRDSSPEEREEATKAIISVFEFDRDTTSPPVTGTSRPTSTTDTSTTPEAPAQPGAGPLGLSSTNQLTPQSMASGIGLGSVVPGSPVQTGGRARPSGPAPITTVKDSIERWVTRAESDVEPTAKEFGQFLWELQSLWSGDTGDTATTQPFSNLGTDPQFLRDSVAGVEGAPGTAPSAGPPRNVLQTMIGGGALPSDSFSVPSDPRQTTPRILSGEPEPVPGWVPAEQAQAYQDTARLLRGAGVEEDTVQMMLELNFKPQSLRQGRQASSPLDYANIY